MEIKTIENTALKSAKMKRKYILIFLISLVLVFLPFYFSNELENLKSLGLLGLFLINFFGNATVFLPAPAIVSVVAAGSIYNPLVVALVSSLGGTAGEMVGFILGHSGKKIFVKNHHFLFLILMDLFKSYGTIIIFIAALIPNPFFDAMGVLAGFLHYSPKKFFIVTFFGRILRNLALSFFGSTI